MDDTGRVRDRGERTEGGEGGGDGRLPAFAVRNVEPDEFRLAAIGLDRCGIIGAPVRNVGEHDFCTFARKHPGLRGAQAARRASAHKHLVIQSVGNFTLLFVDFIPPTRRPAVRLNRVTATGGRAPLPGKTAEDAWMTEARYTSHPP